MKIKKCKAVKQVIQKKADDSLADEDKEMQVSEAGDLKKADDSLADEDKKMQVSEAGILKKGR